jgi:hypothetical protein
LANLLKDSTIQVKMLEILGFAPTTLWTDIAWERLCELVGYDLSESEVKEVFQGGIDDKILYLVKRPVTSISKITFNNIEQTSNSYGIYKERAVNFSRILPQNTRYPYGMSGICNNNEIIVEYTGGFTVDTFPNLLIMVACDLINTLQLQTGEEGNLSSYKISDISYSWKSNAEITGKFDSILENYRSF